RAAAHGEKGLRRHQRGVSLRAVAVPDGVDRGVALCTRRRAVRPNGARRRREGHTLMSHALLMFLGFIAVTLWITWWASRRSAGASAFFAAGRSLTAWQNGIAVAGDYMSAASFLGIAGIIAFQGYDGFMYSVGWLVA